MAGPPLPVLEDTPLVATILVSHNPQTGPEVECCFPEELRGKVLVLLPMRLPFVSELWCK